MNSHSTVVVLDDDESIHRIWKGRADSGMWDHAGIRLVHLSTPDELRQWKIQPSTSPVHYLIDFELRGFDENGLELIQILGISEQSILVTSRSEEPAIRERCLQLKVPLLPKDMAGLVPVQIVG